MMDSKIVLDADYYRQLELDSVFLEMLLTNLYENAGLSWDGEKLQFSSDNLEPLVKAIAPDKYVNAFGRLKTEHERKENGTD